MYTGCRLTLNLAFNSLLQRWFCFCPLVWTEKPWRYATPLYLVFTATRHVEMELCLHPERPNLIRHTSPCIHQTTSRFHFHLEMSISRAFFLPFSLHRPKTTPCPSGRWVCCCLSMTSTVIWRFCLNRTWRAHTVSFIFTLWDPAVLYLVSEVGCLPSTSLRRNPWFT